MAIRPDARRCRQAYVRLDPQQASTMDTSAAPACPECGFRVFNRRYPKCESCGAVLPETIAYTAVERHSLLVADEERQLAHDRLERAPEVTDFGASIDEALLTAAMNLTPDV